MSQVSVSCYAGRWLKMYSVCTCHMLPFLLSQALSERHAEELERVVREHHQTLRRLKEGTYMYMDKAFSLGLYNSAAMYHCLLIIAACTVSY